MHGISSAFDYNYSQKISLVGVSESFSADQLWPRNVSVLIKRCSLPENLSSAENENFQS